MAVLVISAFTALGIVMFVVIVRDQFGRGRHQHSPYQDHGSGGPDGDDWHHSDGGDGGGGGD